MALELELHFTFLQGIRDCRRLAQEVLPRVPDLHGAGAVLPPRDRAFELLVFERVILGPHGQPLVAREVREPLRHRPAGKHPVGRNAQVIVQVSRLVAVDDEVSFPPGGGGCPGGRLRLGGAREIPLASVFLDCHTHPNVTTRQLEGHEVTQVPLLIDEPKGRKSGLTIVLAHGAGAGMESGFMREMAEALSAGSLRVVRFEFPYMQQSGKTRSWSRPDPPAVLESTWLNVIEQVGKPGELVIGGKSMGGRIASMVADRAGVRGLVCLGYPFHPAGRPATLRVAHLEKLATRTLICQGTRDTLGSREDVAAYKLSKAITLTWLEDGDHSFKPRKSSGRTYQQNFQEAVEAITGFCGSL